MSFNILNHLDQLTPDGGSHGRHEGTYHCPVCGAENFKVSLKTGKYSTYSCNCAATAAGKKAIREAIAPLTWEKSPRPSGKKTFTYDGLSNGVADTLVQVVREDDGAGKRSFYQQHWNGQRWVKGLPDQVKARLHLYRIFSPINEQAQGQRILLVEGEGKVDSLLALGIPATCSIGGAGKWHQYGHPNYLEDLAGYQVVLCPDRDEIGVKHCETVAADLEAHDITVAGWLYAFPQSPLWERLPKTKGADIADWIAEGATADEILAAVEPRRELAATSSIPAATHGVDLAAISQRLRSMVQEGLAPSQVQTQLLLINKSAGLPVSELRRLYEALKQEYDRAETQSIEALEVAAQLPDAMTARQATLPIIEALRGDGGILAREIIRVAAAMPVAPEYIVTALLPVLATSIGTSSRIVIKPSAGFVEPCVFWAMNVCPSGYLKTPVLRTAMGGINRLEEAEAARYNADIADYEADLAAYQDTKTSDRTDMTEPTPPRDRRRRIETDGNLPARIQLHHSNPRGILRFRDEGAAFLAELGRFTSGRGMVVKQRPIYRNTTVRRLSRTESGGIPVGGYTGLHFSE
jgi:hypothetical protein